MKKRPLQRCQCFFLLIACFSLYCQATSPIKKSCLFLQAFTETQKKRLLSWKQQVQKLFRSFPRKTLLDISGYRQQRNRGFGQSNSLPTAGSVGGGMGRRNPRQYQIPSRTVPSARLGLLGTSGFVSSTQRNTAANPTIMKQGRQVGSASGRRRVGSHAQGLRLYDVSSQMTPR